MFQVRATIYARREMINFLRNVSLPNSSQVRSVTFLMSSLSADVRILIFVGDDYEDLELWYPKLRLIEARCIGSRSLTGLEGQEGLSREKWLSVFVGHIHRIH